MSCQAIHHESTRIHASRGAVRHFIMCVPTLEQTILKSRLIIPLLEYLLNCITIKLKYNCFINVFYNIKEPPYHMSVRIFIELYNYKIAVQLFYKCILQY